jgi:large subunit ribosomal protein L21
MYAVIKTGGKQYKVAEQEILQVEKLPGEAGTTVEIADVLMLVDGENVRVGTPLIEGASVRAEIMSQGRSPKIRIIKFRRRKHYRKQQGHRQAYTEIRITAISSGG